METGSPDREARMNQIAREIGGKIGAVLDANFYNPRVGFVLTFFEFSESGWASYISNCNREDTVKALREMADKLESGDA